MKRRLSLQDKAMLAMNEAIRKVIERHREAKIPLAVWDREAQKVAYISPAAAMRKFKKNKALKK